jgi:hypothetical protein
VRIGLKTYKLSASNPFTNSLQNLETSFPKLTERNPCQIPLHKIRKRNGSMSIVRAIVVIVLSAYAGSVVGSVQFTYPVKDGTELSQSGIEHR